MSTSSSALHDAKVAELAEEYAREGYEVLRDPDLHLFPFDTFGYRPDLLVRKPGENVMVEVKSTGTRAPIDRFVELVEEVKRHAGWRFVLVTFDDVEIGGVPGEDDALRTWDQLRERVARAERLLRLQEAEAAYLSLWAALEGMLRLEAHSAGLPIERLPSSALIKHLYSHGGLSYEHHEQALAALELRNRVAHGFQAGDLDAAAPHLFRLARELLGEWAPGRRAA